MVFCLFEADSSGVEAGRFDIRENLAWGEDVGRDSKFSYVVTGRVRYVTHIRGLYT